MLVTKKVPDLTLMQKNNGGVFPFAETYNVISGDADVPGHGTREMPIWGDVYRDRAIAQLGPYSARTFPPSCAAASSRSSGTSRRCSRNESRRNGTRQQKRPPFGGLSDSVRQTALRSSR